MANNTQDAAWRSCTHFERAKGASGVQNAAPTTGGPPDLPCWYRERQLDLFGFPVAQLEG